ncbi:MAG TPA: hypothetical protein VKE51_01030 [Vicinamibacterales bacterium]|nr:hypothetical protein [Vicinamibacterales bacterium]
MPLTRRAVEYFVVATAAFGLACYVWIYSHTPYSPIRSDGYSYYVYLPSWFIYRDLTLENLARDWYGGAYPPFTAIRRLSSTGRWLNPHPIGVAVLTSPFFVAADLLSRWSNMPRDGFSTYYHHGAGLAALAYLAAGLAALRRLLSRHFSDDVVLATLVCVTWGTNVFHYGVFDGTFSHVYSFCLVCVWLLAIDEWWTRPALTRSLALGAVAGLIVLVRHADVIYLVLLPAYGVASMRDLAARPGELWDRRLPLAASALAAATVVAPQLLLYRRITAAWLVSPYTEVAGFTLQSPHWFGVLFSTQKGLFFWSPLLLMAVLGAIVGGGWSRRFVAAGAAIFAAQTAFAATWSDWQFGASYGHRAFTDGVGLAGVFIAAAFDWMQPRLPAIRRTIGGAVALLVALSVVQMLQYWTGNLPQADTTWAQYRESFLRFR